MNYFRQYLGGQGEGQVPSGAETVERLVDRVRSSTLLDDRRDAVRALKSLSKKFRMEVGTQAMEVLVHVLQTDRSDTEIAGYAVETLCNILSNDPQDEEEETNVNIPEDIGTQFTEVFIKTTDNVNLILSLLEEYDFHVRWPAVKLLTILLTNKPKDIQEIILTNPMAISKLMDLLSDSREIIRNDGLLLLIQLTRGNNNIQKIVAFENAFERLLDIISEEGSSDGGIVVEDCLLLLLNLLKNNSSNQTFFKEGSFIQRLPEYFDLPPIDQSAQGGWSAQKVTNIHLMLQMVRTLVAPNNPQQQTAICQKVMNQTGLLAKLCNILMASGVPADVLTETINTVSEVIRGNPSNQEYFASVMAPSSPPRPAIVVLLMSMVNDKQPFVLRCAVLYCFQSFLYKNEIGQSQIITTLLPTTAEVNAISAGQLLCGGLFSPDSLSTWFAAVALLHSIGGNCAQKEQLLRVQLATSLGNPPVSLLQQCTNILAQGGKLQTRIGLLMLLCHWLAYCPIAVTHFLHNSANIPFLISQVSASEGDEHELVIQGLCAFLLGICVHFNNDEVENSQKTSLRQIIEKRIGLEMFTDKLSQVSKHEGYSKAAKKPQINYKESSDVLFDYQFTALFKALENDVLKAVSPVQENDTDTSAKSSTLYQHENIVLQYKELIREQDAQLNSVKAELSALEQKHNEADKQMEDMKQQIQQLKDQNALLKAQKGGSAVVSSGEGNDSDKLLEEIESRKKELEEKNTEIDSLKSRLSEADAKAAATSNGEGNQDNNVGDSAALQATVNTLTADIEHLRLKVEQKDEEVKLYRTKYEDTSKQVADLRQQVTSGDTNDSANSALLEERNNMSAKISELENRVKSLEEDNSKLREEKSAIEQRLQSSDSADSGAQEKIKELEAAKQKLEDEKSATVKEMETVKKDQEDLLELLEDQETKIKTYKQRLKALGEQVEEEDDLDDDDDEDDVDDDGDDE